MPWARRGERGSSVVEFVLVMTLLIPLVLGIVHVALVLHIRNTMATAASEGARQASRIGVGPEAGEATARRVISRAVSSRYAAQIEVTDGTVAGVPGTVVRARAEVPPLGLWGPAMRIEVTGRAVREGLP